MGATDPTRWSQSSSILTVLPLPPAQWAPSWDASAVGFTLPLASRTWSASLGRP
jgi:hypothetical protein